MPRQPTLRTAMTPFPYAVELDDPIQRARELMVAHDIRHLPVKQGSELVGIISDRDLKLVLGPYVDCPPEDRELLVRHACVIGAFTVDIATPLVDVVRELASRKIGSALVTKSGRLAGIFTMVDACRCLAELLGKTTGGPDDEADDEAA